MDLGRSASLVHTGSIRFGLLAHFIRFTVMIKSVDSCSLRAVKMAFEESVSVHT
ncbi:Uncharacterized protein DAT39_011813, partial [Clarias magur]